MYYLILTLIGLLLLTDGDSYEVTPEIRCPKQCVCTEESMGDLPLMKWLTIPMNKYPKRNESLVHNKVTEDEEDTPTDSTIVQAAFCVFQDKSNFMEHTNFDPVVQALTILHGADTVNKIIEYELSSFHELLVLDIKGFLRNHTTYDYSEVSLQYNALLELHRLKYLNIQHVRLVPDPNSTNKEIPKSAHSTFFRNYPNLFPNTIHKTKLTFLTPDEPDIIPYNEYKKQSIITTFSHLSNLQFLRLYQCKLPSITWEMFDGLVKLQTLSLEGNYILQIPQFVFYGMPNLKSLVLSNNRIHHIQSESFAGLFELENLDLSGNNLKYLSDVTFAPLPNLLNLDARDNPLKVIYSSTFEVTNMTKALMVSSRDSSLFLAKSAFNGLHGLEKLTVHGLNMSELRENSLTGMPNLRYLNLQGRIEFVDFYSFANSPLLKTLILRNCSLTLVSTDAFYNLLHVKTLDLSENQLESLPPAVFDPLPELNELILSGNKFTTLPGNLFVNLPKLKMVQIDRNDWSCSCDMRQWPLPVMNKVKETKVVEKPCYAGYDKGTCTSEVIEDVYVASSKVVPRCSSPTAYKDWNLIFVVNKKLNCSRKDKHIMGTGVRKAGQKKTVEFAADEIQSTLRPQNEEVNNSLMNPWQHANRNDEANNQINDL